MANILISWDFDGDTGTTCQNSGTLAADGVYRTLWNRVNAEADTDGDQIGEGVVPNPARGQIVYHPFDNALKLQTFEVGFTCKMETAVPSSFYGCILANYCTLSTSGTRYGWYIYPSATLGWVIGVAVGGSSVTYSTGTSPSVYMVPGEVAHWSFVFDRTLNQIRVYKNLVLVFTSASYQTMTYLEGTMHIHGSFQNGVARTDWPNTDLGMAWVDRVYYADGILTREQRAMQLYGQIPINTNVQVAATVFMEPYRNAKTETVCSVETFMEIYRNAKTDAQGVAEVTAEIEKAPVFTYRLTKGLPLTDAEIDKNFTSCNMYSTPTPRFNGGFVTNHAPGNIYFGDIVVDDATGAYTGSGDCWALAEGQALSKKAVAP